MCFALALGDALPRARFGRIAALPVLLLALCGTRAAGAASMHVAPLRADLDAARPVAAITIGNGEETEIAVQAEVVAWTQENGRDIYTPTREVLVNPSIFRIPAQGQQIVRLGLQARAPTDSERSYRLFVRQLPRDRALVRQPGDGVQLQTLLRIGIPVFSRPTRPNEAIEWRLVAEDNSPNYQLMIDNKGSTHVQITSLVVRRDDGEELMRRNISHYVLAGRSSGIALNMAASANLAPDTPLRIDAVAAGGRAIPPLVLRVPRAPVAAR